MIDEENEAINTVIKNYKRQSIDETSQSLEYLPNELLCDFASYLIQLTGLKQKISSEIETVSIETDVGLLTKTHKLNWAKHNGENFKYY